MCRCVPKWDGPKCVTIRDMVIYILKENSGAGRLWTA